MAAVTKSTGANLSPLPISIPELAAKHGVNIPITEQAALFLNAVWAVIPDDELVGITASDSYFKNGAWHSTTTPDWTYPYSFRNNDEHGILDFAQEMNTHKFQLDGSGSIYWHGASRKRDVLSRHHARGGLDDLLSVGALWFDLDIVSHGYDPETGLNLLLDMPLKPSAILWSGGGWQGVHLLSERWHVPNRAAAMEYGDYSRAFYRSVFARAGLQLDRSVFEASREMRLVGYINRKPSRMGAVAQLVYWSDVRYSIDQIKEYAPLPLKTPRVVLPDKPSPAGTYPVGQEFIHYVVEGNTPVERHPTLLQLSLQAARAGIPITAFLEHIRPIARNWFAVDGQPERADRELDSLIDWAYGRALEPSESAEGLPPHGGWLVKFGANGFERASAELQEQHRDRTVILDNQQPKALTQDLQSVRTEQTRMISDYIRAKRTQRIGTYMLVRTSPGAGKTYATQAAVQEVGKAAQDQGDEQGRAALLTLFKFDERSWQQYILEHGGDPSLFGYIVGRNSDLNSDGYCALHTQAEIVASKNYNVVGTLCSRCPFKTQCTETWYLSQFPRMQRVPVLLARYQHGMIAELMQARKLIVFDESPLEVVSGAITLTLEDLVFHGGPVFMRDQYPRALELLTVLVNALRETVAGNPPVTKQHASTEHVRLGGRWLMLQLQHRLGDVILREVMSLDPKVIQDCTKQTLHDTSTDSVTALPKNWLFSTWRLLRYEYETHWLNGDTGWNSRIIAWGTTLRVYPMEGFEYAQNVKVVITDATGLPELYGKAFSYKQQRDGILRELPRQGLLYESDLTPQSVITQFVGTDNTKTALRQQNKRAKEKTTKTTIKLADGVVLDLDPEEITGKEDHEGMERIKRLIAQLAKQHDGSVLVISYKETVNSALLGWNAEHQLLDPKYIQWFGNLRGRNDYKHLSAVVVIGTPRIPPMELLALAQVWHWRDALPIDAAQTPKTEPYLGYVDPIDGKGRGYSYQGYADERVQRLHIGLIQAEMRQCYERIRPNASVDDQGNPIQKHVYIASAFPCADHVDHLQPWITWWVDNIGRGYYEARIEAGLLVHREEFIKHVMQNTECAYNTAKATFERIHREMETLGKAVTAGEKKTKEQIVLDWLAEDPARALQSSRNISRETGIPVATVSRALKQYRG